MKNISLRRALALMLCVLCLASAPVAAFADKSAEKAETSPVPEKEHEPVTVDIGSIYHCYGKTVYNNGGTVYNNDGTVYNNGGIVYNNSGLVYNNGGTVYNNGAEVYNNDGVVHNNGGIVHEHNDGAAAGPFDGVYLVTPSADYSALADISGAETDEAGNFLMTEDSCLIFKAKD